METKNVYGYIRVSTETQVERGYSLDAQEDEIKKYCTKNNLNLVNVFSDEGLSGTLLPNERPALLELINTCKENDIQSVVVYRMDRLARDLGVQLWIEKELLVQKTTMVSVQEGDLSSDDPMMIAFRQMIGMFAELERNTIVGRLSKGKTTKAKQGYKPCGKSPFGYQWSHDRKTVNIVESEADIVKQIFQLNSDGIGYQAIASTLNKQKKFKHNQKQWSREDIYRTLKNKFYIGILTHQGVEIEGKHEPIIDRDVWEAINNK